MIPVLIPQQVVKVFLGKNKNPKDWLVSYPGLLANVGEFEKAASLRDDIEALRKQVVTLS